MEKIPATSRISGDGVLSVGEIFPPRPLPMKPLSPWACAWDRTTRDVLPDELAIIKLTNFSQIDPTHIHSKFNCHYCCFFKTGKIISQSQHARKPISKIYLK